MNVIKAVKITWIDAGSTASWSGVEELTDPGLCYTLGYLVKETDDFYHVSATIGLDDEKQLVVNSTQSIPKAWVKEILEIKDKSATKSKAPRSIKVR